MRFQGFVHARTPGVLHFSAFIDFVVIELHFFKKKMKKNMATFFSYYTHQKIFLYACYFLHVVYLDITNFGTLYRDCIKMNREDRGTDILHTYVHQYTIIGYTLMYV